MSSATLCTRRRRIVSPVRRLWKGIVPVLVHVVVLGDLRLTRRYLLLVLEKIAWAASAHLAGVSAAVMVGL